MKAQRHSIEQPKVTFNDVAGAEEAKAELQEEVDFLRHPKRYHDLGREFPETVGSDELQRILGPRLDSEVEQIGRVVAGPRKKFRQFSDSSVQGGDLCLT